MDCIFCKIIAGELPCHKLYEDETAIAFLDIAPVCEGHTLVVPKRHAEYLTAGTAEEAVRLMSVVHRLAPKIMQGVGGDGFNLGMNQGRSADQDVMHTHLHIMPRKTGTPRTFVKTHPSQDELAVVAEKIRAVM